MSFVLDASVTLAWCFKDEATLKTSAILDKLLDGEFAAVPSLWPLEIVNVLLMAEKKKRINFSEILQFLALVDKLPIQVDRETDKRSFSSILNLAHRAKLTSYDAAYLELAVRKDFALASKDMDLCRAAKKLGVPLL